MSIGGFVSPIAPTATILAGTTVYIRDIARVTPDGELEGITTHLDGSWSAGIQAQTAAVLNRIAAIVWAPVAETLICPIIVDAFVYLTYDECQYAGMNKEWTRSGRIERGPGEGDDRREGVAR
ncbi:hypothetical protein BDV11DRAFT_172757 [Aspergillus similis]